VDLKAAVCSFEHGLALAEVAMAAVASADLGVVRAGFFFFRSQSLVAEALLSMLKKLPRLLGYFLTQFLSQEYKKKVVEINIQTAQ
jgi:hypothetical protein